MRVLPSTSIYVMLISETIKDVDWFMLMFLICLCAFANALMVLSEYQKNKNELDGIDGDALYGKSIGLEFADAFVN